MLIQTKRKGQRKSLSLSLGVGRPLNVNVFSPQNALPGSDVVLYGHALHSVLSSPVTFLNVLISHGPHVPFSL